MCGKCCFQGETSEGWERWQLLATAPPHLHSKGVVQGLTSQQPPTGKFASGSAGKARLLCMVSGEGMNGRGEIRFQTLTSVLVGVECRPVPMARLWGKGGCLCPC